MADEDKFADEIMIDDELDQVTGGGTGQCQGDNNFLANIGIIERQDGSLSNIMFHWDSFSKIIDAGWAKVGVTCCTVFGAVYDNKYWIGGKEVSRKEAFAHALRQNGCSEKQIANFKYEQYQGSF